MQVFNGIEYPYEEFLNLHNFQSINQNLYSASSRYLHRGAPDPGQAEKNSL